MAKFNTQEKLAAVNRALKGNESYLLHTNDKFLHKWIKQYKYNGVEAFTKCYTS